MTRVKMSHHSRTKIKKNTKILLLCHGNKHSFCDCPFPISKKMMKYIVTLDQNESCEPDIVEDFTKPTCLKKDSIDLAGGIYYPQDLIVNEDGTLQQNSFFPNIIKLLKHGGYYILTKLPRNGLSNFCNYLRSEEGQCFLMLIRKARTLKPILKNDIDKMTFEDKIIINKALVYMFNITIQN
jgi:hypothetical protein